MANSLLPPEERNLTPDQVEALDKRREWGHTLLVIACQFAVIATVLLLWVGQDLTYSPRLGPSHGLLLRHRLRPCCRLGLTGFILRSGTPAYRLNLAQRAICIRGAGVGAGSHIYIPCTAPKNGIA